jgi:hypothetical protein
MVAEVRPEYLVPQHEQLGVLGGLCRAKTADLALRAR